jgi:hypothetical protein
VIVTDRALIRPPLQGTNQSANFDPASLFQYGLDPARGLREYKPSELPSPEVLILWGENRSSSPFSFVPLIDSTPSRDPLINALNDLESIILCEVSQRGNCQGRILKAATLLLGQETEISDLTAPTILYSAKRSSTPFARLLLALDKEGHRSRQKFEQVARAIAEKARPSRALPRADILESNIPKEKWPGFTMLWSAIFLFRSLGLPCIVSEAEIREIRAELQKPPPPPPIRPPSHTSSAQNEDITGKRETRIGVIGGAFSDAETALDLMKRVSELKPPPLPPDFSPSSAFLSSPSDFITIINEKLD